MSAQIEKYRQAGIIAQNALDFVIRQLHKDIGEQSLGEVCRLGDEFIKKQTAQCFTTIKERGIAQPVEICKNELVSGIAPSAFDKFQGGIVTEGDLVKVSLGVHIDGYTVMAGHTVIIREEQIPQQPAVGDSANAVIASYLATEAVVSLLSSVLSETHSLHGVNVTGTHIRAVVEEIAQAFGTMVVPGSRVRRIKRFVAGQKTVRDSLPVVEWREHSDEDETKLIEELDANFEATAGHTYLVDIAMAARNRTDEGYVKLVEMPSVGSVAEEPSIYMRDFTVTYALRSTGARKLVKEVDNKLSVYPFKLDYLDAADIGNYRVGLKECISHHLIVGEPRLRAMFTPEYRPKDKTPLIAAREVTTISLIPGAKSGSGYPEALRFSGGRFFPPSWTHTERVLDAGPAADALNARLAPHQGIRYVEVKPTRLANEQMDIE